MKRWWIFSNYEDPRGPFDGLIAVKQELSLPLQWTGHERYVAISTNPPIRREYHVMTTERAEIDGWRLPANPL